MTEIIAQLFYLFVDHIKLIIGIQYNV